MPIKGDILSRGSGAALKNLAIKPWEAYYMRLYKTGETLHFSANTSGHKVEKKLNSKKVIKKF